MIIFWDLATRSSKKEGAQITPKPASSLDFSFGEDGLRKHPRHYSFSFKNPRVPLFPDQPNHKQHERVESLPGISWQAFMRYSPPISKGEHIAPGTSAIGDLKARASGAKLLY
jgi:hypothetical protein